MKRKKYSMLVVIFIVSFFVFSSVTAIQAKPSLQTTTNPTPTPGPDGRILYLVQDGDTLWDIAAKFGFNADYLDQLRLLNNMDDGDVVISGEFLIIAIQEQQDTGDDDNEIDLTPEATPISGSGDICILLYEDVNGDSFRQESEPSISDGAVSATEKLGLYSESKPTVEGFDPVCFVQIPEGKYNISVALPDNYNPTTFMTTSLTLFAGDTVYINFGGQLSVKEIVDVIEEGQSDQNSSNLLYGVFGILFVIGGAGLGIYNLLRGRKATISDKK